MSNIPSHVQTILDDLGLSSCQDDYQRHLIDILDDQSSVFGEIYWMFNTTTGKGYLGQTVTHRKNRNRYRPFGFIGRFKDHISEAMNNTKTKQCAYLNASIRKYHSDDSTVWTVALVTRCRLTDLDDIEISLIKAFDSYFPKGYNLTCGGKGAMYDPKLVVRTPVTAPPNPDWRSKPKSEETRAKMKERALNLAQSASFKEQRAKAAVLQHMNKRLVTFKDVRVQPDSYELYATEYPNAKTPQVILKIDGKTTRFCGENASDVAKQFYETLLKNSKAATAI